MFNLKNVYVLTKIYREIFFFFFLRMCYTMLCGNDRANYGNC